MFPRLPVIEYPVAGKISHTKLPGVQAPEPESGTMAPILVLVIETCEFTQTVSLGLIVNLAIALREMRIPPMEPGVSPHGFEIRYDIVKELLVPDPQLVVLNKWLNDAGTLD